MFEYPISLQLSIRRTAPRFCREKIKNKNKKTLHGNFLGIPSGRSRHSVRITKSKIITQTVPVKINRHFSVAVFDSSPCPTQENWKKKKKLSNETTDVPESRVQDIILCQGYINGNSNPFIINDVTADPSIQYQFTKFAGVLHRIRCGAVHTGHRVSQILWTKCDKFCCVHFFFIYKHYNTALKQ